MEKRIDSEWREKLELSKLLKEESALGIKPRAGPENVIEVFIDMARGAKRRVSEIFAVETGSETIVVAPHAREGGNLSAFKM